MKQNKSVHSRHAKTATSQYSTLYLSCFSGISGNMFIGALLDAGLPEADFRKMVSALPISGYKLKIEPVMKQGIKATHFDVILDHSEHHVHRHLADITRIIEDADLSDRVKKRSSAVFTKLAEAEAKVHGTTVEKIHFHEVGAADAIIDVVGTLFALEKLGIEQVYAGSLRTGRGFIQCAHGSMPIPAPATAELLTGIPYKQGDIEKELLTPTGAALLATLCEGFGDLPDGFVSEKIAYGAGGWDLDIPNVLRAQFGQLRCGADSSDLLVLETNIDDCNPQIFDYAIERLFEAGALDVWLTPVQMKKNRPAVTLSVLVRPALQDAMETILFAETTTIGIRCYAVTRTATERREETADTPWGPVRIKTSSIKGKMYSVTPEFEDCRNLARTYGVPLKDVLTAARLAT